MPAHRCGRGADHLAGRRRRGKIHCISMLYPACTGSGPVQEGPGGTREEAPSDRSVDRTGDRDRSRAGGRGFAGGLGPPALRPLPL